MGDGIDGEKMDSPRNDFYCYLFFARFTNLVSVKISSGNTDDKKLCTLNNSTMHIVQGEKIRSNFELIDYLL